MLRTASSLPLTGPLTLGSDLARFQTKPPACYRASWQLPGPDFHRQAATSLRTRRSTMALTSWCHLPSCWAHRKSALNITMWLAVLLDGIFGGDMTFTSSPTNVTTMPSAVAVALFTVIGTSAIVKRSPSRPDTGCSVGCRSQPPPARRLSAGTRRWSRILRRYARRAASPMSLP